MSSPRPNLLLFLTDGMQGATVDAGHPCLTPHFDELARRGVQFTNAHTTCPTCSPARASLLTGQLPHNHGVLEVEHGRDPDQCVLRADRPHFAQHLAASGYRTGYFGKWHVERTNELQQFGWQDSVVKGAEHLSGLGRGDQGPKTYDLDDSLTGYIEGPPGYNRVLHWGVTDTSIDKRYPGITLSDAETWLDDAAEDDAPWCCCVSFSEPNEALVAGRDAWNRYDAQTAPLPENFFDDMSDRPNLYGREQSIGRDIPEAHWRAARACYHARISELDDLFGRLMSRLETAGALDNTIIILLSDHGRYVGAHGFEAHNFGPFEEIYRIPLVVAGPGIASGMTSSAPVSIADLCPTICELAESEPIDVPDSRSIVPLLLDPAMDATGFETGFAEYHGTRFSLTQRIVWRDNWKFVFNGFDYDELYDLASDPHEMRNLASDPDQRPRIESMMSDIWDWIRRTNDRTILETHYYSMRLAAVGPNPAAG